MKGIPDMGGLYSMPDRLAWEAGEIGDREHPEPEYDCNGYPITKDTGEPIYVPGIGWF